MSSMLANFPSSQEAWSRPSHQPQYMTAPPQPSHSEGNSANTWFMSGLPTPPGSRVMNSLSVGSAVPTFHPNPSYPTRYPSERPLPQQELYPPQNNVQYPQHSRMNSLSGSSSSRSHRNPSNLIASHLQIPESVNKSKGSLAEFTAELTCMFWHESRSTIKYAENLPLDAPVDRAILPEATPTIGFRKWVTTMLSTTQVGKNVILLALLFIYRLQRFHAGFSGKTGSEFRLLTIALMLGNKFLDDNTYTNKTWAEVSGIGVVDIHHMEMEFLQNMKYDLYVSEAGWKEWKATLGRLGSFYEKALNFNTAELPPVTPLMQSFGHKLPSPPSTHHLQYPYGNTGVQQNGYVGLPNPAHGAPYLPPSPLRQQRATSVDLLNSRKRSLDAGSEQPSNKRLHLLPSVNPSPGMLNASSYLPQDPRTASVPPMAYGQPLEGPNNVDIPRLPMPFQTMSTPVSNNNQLAPLSMPVNRAMASVYPPATAAWSQPVTPISAVPANLYQNSIPTLGEMSRTQSNVPSAHTSPVGNSNSPSYFLMNRSSPYRPVRGVNTLLMAPPQAALQTDLRNIDHDQIRYQPLSKANTEHRVGLIPYHYPEGWQGSNANTPIQQNWPYRF